MDKFIYFILFAVIGFILLILGFTIALTSISNIAGASLALLGIIVIIITLCVAAKIYSSEDDYPVYESKPTIEFDNMNFGSEESNIHNYTDIYYSDDNNNDDNEHNVISVYSTVTDVIYNQDSVNNVNNVNSNNNDNSAVMEELPVDEIYQEEEFPYNYSKTSVEV
jgi:hypothetical protein